jgi:hypothetical protein
LGGGLWRRASRSKPSWSKASRSKASGQVGTGQPAILSSKARRPKSGLYEEWRRVLQHHVRITLDCGHKLLVGSHKL